MTAARKPTSPAGPPPRSPPPAITHDVYRKGEGPGVVLIPEMPGLHPGVLALGNHLVDNGFTVASPSLFGDARRAARCGLARCR